MLKQVLEIVELLDDSGASGEKVRDLFGSRGHASTRVSTITGEEGQTDFVRLDFPGYVGASLGGQSPTIGIVGRLGGIGARPAQIGLVSDADGAICALAVALKLADMRERGDVLPGDVIVATHICPDAPVKPHDPVPFMSAPVDMQQMNAMEVDPAMDAVLSIDTTKGNHVINHNGFAITPTAKSGYLLPVAKDLLEIMRVSTGRPPAVLALSQQDITPYGNGLDHINSLMQPATATGAPTVGVAITAETPVPGCATGSSREVDIASAGQFVLETAIRFGRGACAFYAVAEWERLLHLYGSMEHFQGAGEVHP